MGYIERNLMAGEEVIYRAKLHWIIYMKAIVWFVLAIVACAALAGADYFIVGGVCLAISLYSLFSALLAQWGSDYVVTNKRVILKTGIISRSTVELMLTKCEGVSADQNILGRILNYGTLITTTGGVTNRFKQIEKPIVFKNHINDQIDRVQRK